MYKLYSTQDRSQQSRMMSLTPSTLLKKFESTLSCSSFSQQLKRQNKSDQKIRLRIAGKLTKSHLSKIVVRNYTRIINSSRSVSFPTENIESSNERVVARQKRTLIGQADESSGPMVQKAKLLELKLLS